MLQGFGSMGTIRNIIFSTILLAVSVAICATAGEVFRRLKNNSMKNYDIEMWRYAKEQWRLKF
jgi:hypothetical protein